MTSIEFHLRSSSRGRTFPGSLFIRIIHARKAASITTPLRLYPHEWNKQSHQVVYKPENTSRFYYLKEVETLIAEENFLLSNIVRLLEKQGEFTVHEVADIYKRRKNGAQLLPFVEKLTKELTSYGQERTARAYQTVTNGFIYFVRNKKISLHDIKPILIQRFERDMLVKGKSLNTISFYMRNLRAIYNRAIKERIVDPVAESPFADVFTGVQVTKKRALSKDEMALLFNLDLLAPLPSNKSDIHAELIGKRFVRREESHLCNAFIRGDVDGNALREAWLLFMFSFYARGMSFVDIAYLKKTDISNGIITYYRRKTGQKIEIKITSAMNKVIDCFHDKANGSPYVFPIIQKRGVSKRLQYESALRLQNNRLKRLADLCRIRKKLSTHVARHTWATIAKGENLPLSVISEGLGHSSEKTTAIYLASFDRSVIDRAGDAVVRAVKRIKVRD